MDMVSAASGVAWEALHAVRGAGRSPDGLISVTVEGGQPSQLHIKPAAMALTSTDLAERVLAAMRMAFDDVREQVAQRLEEQPAWPGSTSTGAVAARVREEVERVSAQVSSQLEDANRRLNRLIGES